MNNYSEMYKKTSAVKLDAQTIKDLSDIYNYMQNEVMICSDDVVKAYGYVLHMVKYLKMKELERSKVRHLEVVK